MGEATRGAGRRLAHWEARRSEIVRLLELAAPSGHPNGNEPGRYLGVQLGPDERELLALTGIDLLEAPEPGERTRGQYAEVALNTPVSLRVGARRDTSSARYDEPITVDTGSATITNRRVLFRGPKQTRVWDLQELVGIDEDDEEPIVYFQAGGREKTGGLRSEAADRMRLVETLELAVALSRGDGASYAEALKARLRAHDANRPVPGADKQGESSLDRATETVRRMGAWVWRFARDRAPLAAPWQAGGVVPRLLARVVDGFLYALAMTFSLGIFDLFTLGNSTDTFMGTLVGAGVVVFLETISVSNGGMTVGKRWTRIRVVDMETGRPPTGSRALLRSAVMAGLVLSVVGMLLDVALAIVDPNRQSVHDRLSRTIVVRAR